MSLLSIIIPCFNEEATVEHLLGRVISQDLSTFGIEKDILVVDDASTDGSARAVERFRDAHPGTPVRLIRSSAHRGKGWALRLGLESARGDFVLVQDADLEYDPQDYPTLLRPLLAGVAPVVYGSRWLAPVMPISGTLYSLGGWMENRFLHVLYRTNISDIATGYKLFRSDLIRTLDLECVGFEFCPEVTAKLLNRQIPIVEVPIHYRPRTKKEGKKIRWPDLFVALYTLTRLRITRS